MIATCRAVGTLSFHNVLLTLAILLKAAWPVVAVMLYVVALASAVYMLRDKRGRHG